MCIGSPDIDTSYQDFQMAEAERARAEEAARQKRIEQGMEQIRAVFEGGTYTPTAVPRSSGNAFEAAGGFLSSGTVGEPVTYEGVQPFLEQREQAQRDFYMPQLDQQFGKAKDDVTFALSRAGLLDSTVAGERQADLSEKFALERGSILARIASDIAGQKTNLNQQRSAIEAGLRASGDASQAADQALSAAVTFRQDQPTLDPLGNLFYGISEGIGAARTGQEVDRIRRLARPSPLNTSNAGRLVA